VTILEDGELIGAAQTDFNGVVTQIPQATGLNAQGGQLQGFIPTSASNQGDIVGVVTDYFAEPFPAPADYQYVLTEYHATTQQTTALDGGILVSGYAYINDAGLAVFYDDASEGPTIYNTADGQSTNIDAGPAGTASPTGINQNGDVIGTAFSGVRLTGFLYDPSNHSVTIFPTTANCQQFNPIAINDDGTVVGDAEFEVKVRHHHAWQKRAAIYSGGVITDLNTLAPLDGVVLTEATSINDAGQILADDAINPVASANHLYVLAPR
jgi:hypothetical protein